VSRGILRHPFVQGLLATLAAALLMVSLVAATVALTAPFVADRSCSAAVMLPLFPFLLPVILAAGLFTQTRVAACLSDDARLFARRLVIAGCLLSSLLLGVFGSFVSPRFLDVFANFGADLPAPTLVALMPGHFFWLVPVCVIVGWIVNCAVPLRMRWFGWTWAVEACLLVLVVGAMYLPIFKLGCVIE